MKSAVVDKRVVMLRRFAQKRRNEAHKRVPQGKRMTLHDGPGARTISVGQKKMTGEEGREKRSLYTTERKIATLPSMRKQFASKKDELGGEGKGTREMRNSEVFIAIDAQKAPFRSALKRRKGKGESDVINAGRSAISGSPTQGGF